MVKSLTLKFDPYEIFRSNNTPISLYARREWLGEENSGRFKRDVELKVGALLGGQGVDGSWNGSVVETCKRLFQIYLSTKRRTPEVEKALMWLFEMDLVKTAPEKVRFERLPKVDLTLLKKQPEVLETSLPFVPTPLRRLKASMSLYLATAFGWLHEEKVKLIFEFFASEAEHYGDWGISTSNFMRAYVLHPEYENKPFMKTIIGYLGRKQTGRGDWGQEFNFYQVFNVLAHSKDTRAYQQVARAYELLVEMQNENGSWGKAPEESPELSTYLVVQGLRAAGLL
ncbi:MAG: hypothetical protein ACTSU5_20655 [Promethearchaeota archaeon]